MFPDANSCECEICPIGTYNDIEQSDTCPQCQPGYTTMSPGREGSSFCVKSENLATSTFQN